MKRSVVLCLLTGVLLGCGQDAPPGGGRPGGPRAHLVEVVQVQPARVALERKRSGTLRHLREVEIHTQEAGQITELPWYPGDRVEAGQLLVKLDDRLLRSEYNRARASLREAQQNLARLRELAANRLVSREELLRRETEAEVTSADLELLETRLSYTEIKAPFAGVITARMSEPGNVAERYDHLLTLADPQVLVVDVSLSELILAQLKLGDPVDVMIDALGFEPQPAVVSRIYPQVDPVTRRGTLEIRLDPVPEGARAGQFVRVQLQTTARERLLVPFSALRFDNASFLYIVNEAGEVVRREVVTGSRLADRIEILDGIAPGERVVTRGFLGLVPGQKVEVVSLAMGPESSGNER
ncbi:MexH family multidrug efflux RND transporter periplasmic adaptor subunit [Marinobacterium zhoushanense]|uniref:MexH family multidrug efflux RND transporter periplasmic adaptor subunit n=1 Tax=Marinobacterium zhoushanense TaxID=1679163 RepID=A0ABQ1KJD1_9GAMM|nr:efflux RND transporter periplasmic adaptor subunit [Marinobacterium zhoushanense]GGB97715.1 MexH family multidrug efflux RND transporter periplasmic adaptor subunit [Marinobacterium zhoushanense]